MRNSIITGLVCLCLTLSSTILFSQDHSTCATADLLLLDTNCGGIATGPGANSGDPTGYDGTDIHPCDQQHIKGDDYIYLYTATSSQALRLELWASDNCNLFVTSGCPIGGTCIAESTSFTYEYESLITPGLSSGVDYYIHISSTGDDDSAGQFCMDAELVPAPLPPINDECSSAIPLTITSELDCSVSTPGTVRLATASPESTTSCSNVNYSDDVWFSFVATAESHAIRLINLENLNGGEYLKHSLWEGSCGSLTLVNECPFTNVSAQNDLTIGDTYYIRVCTQFEGPTTINFDICVSTFPSAPANDECAGAYNMIVNDIHKACNSDYKVYGSIGGATASAEDTTSCEGDENDDVWFSFQAVSTKHTISITTDYYFYTGYFTNSIWEGTCGSLSLVQCNEGSPQQLTDLTVGDTYYVRIYSEESVPSISSFEVCVSTPPTPIDNDDCLTSITIDIPEAETCQQPTVITNKAITPTDDEDTSCDNFLDNYGIWYDFIAPSNGAFIFEQIEGLPALAIFEGPDCSNLTEVPGNCIEFYENGGTVSGLTPGAEYYALIWMNYSYNNSFEFCLYSSQCIAPKYTTEFDESSCPKIAINVTVTDLGSASSVDITSDAGPDSHIGVGLGTYSIGGFTVGVEDDINISVSDNADNTCEEITPHQNPDTCTPDCGSGQVIGCGQNVNTGDLGGVGKWGIYTCNSASSTVAKIYNFSPTEDGDHILHVENIAGAGWINYYYRTDAVCESTNWLCLGEVYSTNTEFTIPNLAVDDKVFILANGQNYYEGRLHNFRIECPVADCTLSASRIYVNAGANGNNTGCSWEHAFPSLQMAFEAMAQNASIDEVWVQKGNYYPSYGSDRFSSFSIDQAISIYGGFAGDETDINQRDILNNPTTISGDIAVQGATYDNSYHVFTIASGIGQVIIDGFNIISGNADGNATVNQSGAGVLCYGDAELINCTISQCESLSDGAAIRLEGASADLTCENVTAEDNTASGNGSSVSLKQNSQLKVKGVTRFD